MEWFKYFNVGLQLVLDLPPPGESQHTDPLYLDWLSQLLHLATTEKHKTYSKSIAWDTCMLAYMICMQN